MGHIWIGPLEPPSLWMKTWKDSHPDWEYRLYDNNFLSEFNFRTRHLIDKYYELEMYEGVADLMRLEILYEYGGFIPPADSWCYHNTDELFTEECCYTVYENEFIKGKLVSPILACEAGNRFVGTLIEELVKVKTENIDCAWKTTGNLFVAKMIEKYKPNIVIFPSYYFIPVHFEGLIYEGEGKVYAKQFFGTTRNKYRNKNIWNRFVINRLRNYKLKYKRKEFNRFISNKQNKIFNIDFS